MTLADQAAYCAIAERLVGSGPVVVSEEGEDLHFAAERYWFCEPAIAEKNFN